MRGLILCLILGWGLVSYGNESESVVDVYKIEKLIQRGDRETISKLLRSNAVIQPGNMERWMSMGLDYRIAELPVDIVGDWYLDDAFGKIEGQRKLDLLLGLVLPSREVLELLKARPFNEDFYPFVGESFSARSKVLDRLLSKDKRVREIYADDLMYAAAMDGNSHAIKVLLKHGARPPGHVVAFSLFSRYSQKTKYLRPLIDSSEQKDLVKLLVDAGGDVNAKYQGFSPLAFAMKDVFISGECEIEGNLSLQSTSLARAKLSKSSCPVASNFGDKYIAIYLIELLVSHGAVFGSNHQVVEWKIGFINGGKFKEAIDIIEKNKL